MVRAWELLPPTAAGLVVGGGSFVAFRTYGVAKEDLLLLVIGAMGLLVTGLANALVVLVALRVAWSARRRPAGDPVELECGLPFRTGLRIADPWLPFVDIAWTWVEPQSSIELTTEGLGRSERVTLHQRGEWPRITRRFVVSDAFGLARVAFLAREPRALRVLPATGELTSVPLSQALGQGEDLSDPLGAARGDLYDQRPYAPGDPIRHVLWKVYARTRALVVRVPERALAPLPQTVAFLVGGDEAPAGAARVAIEGGLFGGDFRFAADGLPGSVDQPEAAIDVVVRSGVANTTYGAGLGPFLEASRGMRRAMVFTPARPGPWLDSALAACSTWADGEGVVDFVVCTDGVDRSAKPGRLSRALFAAPAAVAGPSAVTTAELDAVVKALGRSGARVIVVDRSTGAVS